MKESYQVFTHKDLDGAVSLLTFMWSKPHAQISYRDITNTEIDIVKDYLARTCNPPKIMIFDVALREEFLPELDDCNIEYIDHHERSTKFIPMFKNSIINWKNETSNTILVRKIYKDVAPEFTEAQKKLILFADDHDQSEWKFPESYNLNILFWTQFKNQFCYFCDYYKNGFMPFSSMQLDIIKRSKLAAKKKVDETKCFGGKILIEGEPKNVVAAMTENFNNIVIDMLVNKYKPDIFFYINTRTDRVSMRQPKSEKIIDLAAFARKYCDGDGNNHTAGGNLTPLFLEIAKKLSPL
jgi:hypothetical protein